MRRRSGRRTGCASCGYPRRSFRLRSARLNPETARITDARSIASRSNQSMSCHCKLWISPARIVVLRASIIARRARPSLLRPALTNSQTIDLIGEQVPALRSAQLSDQDAESFVDVALARPSPHVSRRIPDIIDLLMLLTRTSQKKSASGFAWKDSPGPESVGI